MFTSFWLISIPIVTPRVDAKILHLYHKQTLNYCNDFLSPGDDDGDGIPDHLDNDDDNDGIPDDQDVDDDGDGIPDSDEGIICT